MKERLTKLLTVKSIVTIALTVVFSVLSLRGTLTGQEFLGIFSVVVAFYFGTQYEKNGSEKTTPQSAAPTAPLTRGALESVPAEGDRESGERE